MTQKWDVSSFYEFIELRDRLRMAKKAKAYHDVVSLGGQILALDKRAPFLQIATAIFLKDMGNAYIKLNDVVSATNFLQAARAKYIELRSKPLRDADDWKKDIELIEKKIFKLTTSNKI
jgi:hypothetical protein